jgi:endoglucanase
MRQAQELLGIFNGSFKNMKKGIFYFLWLACFLPVTFVQAQNTWIRINQLGYTPNGIKVAVWCSKEKKALTTFALVDAATQKIIFTVEAGNAYGAYGPFVETYRLDFSFFREPGKYFLKTGNTQSPVFTIGEDVYKGTADFCLRYMRQQRSGFNPFLNDSCHTHDGYTLYGPMPDSTHIDVTGGWHDASDYLQYSTTSANATYHLLAAYRDFPKAFSDTKQANGLDGKNGVADILDEANWGLKWLLKMHPRPDWMFNQLGDDRDHVGLRIPKEDKFYGKGFERPVYFINGKPQQRGKFMNATTGGASTAGKFASAFALGSEIYGRSDPAYAKLLQQKALDAWKFGKALPGVAQTVSVRSPYIYAEDNWVDDMELAAVYIAKQNKSVAYDYARQEPITPWLGSDTAKHYQWYPFINLGHYELAKNMTDKKKRDTIIGYYKTGIEKVWSKAKNNAFYRGIPFIWCSNNLTTSFAIQCYWYEQLSGDQQYAKFAQANIDWLFGCNPWGTSMVYGLPADGDTPVDPHSAFTHLKNYPIDGGLVDGPVYTSIFKGLIGIQLIDADEYAEFQSNLAVYHDDYGDYSTNEPTMDGTASLIYLLAAKETEATVKKQIQPATAWHPYQPLTNRQYEKGAFTRGDSTKKNIFLVFTGDEFGDGLSAISNTLQKQNVKGSFFFTGRFYRNTSFQPGIKKLKTQQHYFGPHSDQHFLYCDWNNRDSLLVTKAEFKRDMLLNGRAMQDLGLPVVRYFIPPYEWWNETIAGWAYEMNRQIVNFTSGTTSNADYTYPEMGKSYRSSDEIIRNIKKFNETRPGKLNGVILLVHAGTDPRRTDKLYNRLDELIEYLKKERYQFKKIDELFH